MPAQAGIHDFPAEGRVFFFVNKKEDSFFFLFGLYEVLRLRKKAFTFKPFHRHNQK
jgi:hypothetical protein